jgi:hypothetical protein
MTESPADRASRVMDDRIAKLVARERGMPRRPGHDPTVRVRYVEPGSLRPRS